MGSYIQNIIIVLGLIALAAFGYYLYTNQSSLSLNSQVTENTTAQSQMFLRQLQEVKAIDFDMSLFNNPEFNNLRNQSARVSPRPVGRPNPFSAN